MENVKKTTLGHGSAAGGPFTLVGSLMGDIFLPTEETEVQKARANDDTAATLIIGDTEMGDVEMTVAYEDHAAYVALQALLGVLAYYEFTIPQGAGSGDKFEYEAVLSKIGPATGSEDGAITGPLSLTVGRLVGSAASV